MPYPVDRMTYDKTIAISEEAVRKIRLAPTEKDKAIRRLQGSQISTLQDGREDNLY